MHSFSLTPRFIVLFKSPLSVNKYKLLLGLPFHHTQYCENNQETFFILIDRQTGAIQEIATGESFVCLHSANAFETTQEVVLDLVCYPPLNPYSGLYRDNLFAANSDLPRATLRRFRINQHTKKCSAQLLCGGNHEFPRLNERHLTQSYKFLYTASLGQQAPFFNAIQKLNVHTQETLQWQLANYFVGEPVFVSHNNSREEDKGLLLFFAFNSTTQTSSFILLDAQTMQQLAEVVLPIIIPFGLHGNFIIS